MKIHADMDLTQLADRMGETAEHGDAIAMREILCATDHTETSEIPEAEWLSLLDEAICGPES